MSYTKPRTGYFLRAESFFNIAAIIDSQSRFAPDLSLYGRGMCEASSEAVPGAYRCFAADYVLDPCWADSRVAQPRVVCLARPWGRHIWMIDLQVPLDPAHPAPAPVPWGVQLSGGQRCLLLQGAKEVVDHRLVNYFCSRTLALLGQPDRRRPRWRMRAVHHRAGRYRLGGRAAIATAYFGAV